MSKAFFALAVVAVVGVYCLALGQEQPPPRRERAKAQERNGQPEPGAPRQESARGAPRGQVGRYQMAVRDGASGSPPYIVVCDTTTGRCWVINLTQSGDPPPDG